MATAEFPRDAAPQLSPTDHGATLAGNLERLAARRNFLAMRRAIVRALIPAVAISALGILAYRFYLLDGEVWMPIALMLGALAIGYRNGRLAQRGAFAAALDADQKLGLDDEISSALAFARPEAARRATLATPANDWKSRVQTTLFPRLQWQVAGSPRATALVPALVADAAHRSTQIDGKTLYPTGFDRPLKVLCALSALLLGVVLMPDNPYFLKAEDKQLVKTLQAQGGDLQQIAKKVQQKKDAAQSEKTRALARRLEALGRKMQRGRMTKKSALVGLGQLKRDMEKATQNDRSAPSSDTARLEEALRNGTYESPALQQAQRELKADQREAAAKQLEQLADKAEKGQLSQQEKEQAARDLERAAQQLRKQGGQANQQAAQQLEEAAKSLREGQQSQQGQQQQGQNGQQQQGQNGQKQQGQQKGQQQGQQGQQSQQGKNGQQQQGQNGQQQGQQGQQQQGQKGQQQGKQSGQQSGQQQGSQQGQQSGQQSSQSQQSPGGGEQQGQQGQSGGQQGAANALRGMANGVRGGSAGGGQSLRDMMKKIEEAENQTGSNMSGQAGQGKPGQGQGSGMGQGQGQMMTPGKDLRATDPTRSTGGGPGLGPRNNIQGGQKSGGGLSNVRTRRTGDKRRWGDVWSDRLPKTRSKLDRITGKMGSQGEAEQLSTRTEARSGSVKTPYYDVYESYKKDAEDAISRESVPPAYKAPVKEYFDSLKP